MPSPAANYAAITNGVEKLISTYAENDRAHAAYQVLRAAVTLVRIEFGDDAAAEMVWRIVDEMVEFGARR